MMPGIQGTCAAICFDLDQRRRHAVRAGLSGISSLGGCRGQGHARMAFTCASRSSARTGLTMISLAPASSAAARPSRFDVRPGPAAAGNRENLHRRRLAPDLRDCFQAVEMRHHEIADHQVRPVPAKHRKAMLAVLGHRHLVAAGDEDFRHHVAERRLVVDDQDFHMLPPVPAEVASASRRSQSRNALTLGRSSAPATVTM
jgi:hypothetical protein